jgi:hypothetical protein
MDLHFDAARAGAYESGRQRARVLTEPWIASQAYCLNCGCAPLDLLVDPQDRMSLFDLGAIIAELNELLGIRVDVATPAALPEPMRQRVLRDAMPV